MQNRHPKNHHSHAASSTRTCMTLVQFILFAAILANAAEDASETAAGLYEAKSSLRTLTAAFIISILCSIGLNRSAVKQNTEELIEVATKGLPHTWPEDSERKLELMEEWPQLPPRKEKMARIWAVMSIPVILNDGANAKFFVDSLPKDYKIVRDMVPASALKAISFFILTGTGIVSIGTKVIEPNKIIRKKMSDSAPTLPQNKKSTISQWIAYPLTSIDGLMTDSAKNYTVMRTILGIKQHSIPVAAATLILAPMNIIFQADFATTSLYNAMDYLSRINKESNAALAKNFVIFSLAFGMSFSLAYINRYLNEFFYHEVAESFDMDNKAITNPLFFGLSWISFAQEILLNTASLHEAIDHTHQHTGKKLSYFGSSLHARFFKSASQDDIAFNPDKQPLLLDDELALDIYEADGKSFALKENKYTARFTNKN